MKRRDVLEAVEDCENTFGSLITGGAVPRRDVMRQVRAGLVKSVGMRTVLDGDEAPVDPERFAEGFVLTADGRRWLHDPL